MALTPRSSFPLVCFLFFTVAAVITSVSAVEFEVGGHVGWRVPAINESELYNVWASRRRFHIGDTLRFRYKNDSVVVVDKRGLYHCDSSKPIAFFNDGDTVVNLDNIGTMYFISGDAKRCKQGVKMMVDVINAGPISHFPPTIASPPEVPYPAMAPAPSQFLSSGGTPESSPGPSSSDAVMGISVSLFGIALIAGLVLCVLNP